MPRLVTVSGRQFELEPGRAYRLGRDPASDIVLEDCTCSRHHARLVVARDGQTVWIEDHKSRNGTFLDGSRLEAATAVPQGAELRIGSTIFNISYHQLDEPGPETREVREADALFFEAPEETRRRPLSPREDEAIAGHLGSISLPEVLQLLYQMGRSGCLKLDFQGEHASIHLVRGEVQAARFGDGSGEDVLHALARRKDGRFHFVEGTGPIERGIRRPTPELLLDICRTLDETTSVDEAVGAHLPHEGRA